MFAKTLKTLVQKTVTVGSVKLPTPADRIGQGLVDVATNPAEVLSSGQFPLPHNPGSEPNPGSRPASSASSMRKYRGQVAPPVPPAGPAGCLFPGSSAHRRPSSLTTHFSEKWQGLATKRPAATTRTVTATGITATASTATMDADQCRASFPAIPSLQSRLGSDCQSPDRRDDFRTANTEATLTAAAGK